MITQNILSQASLPSVIFRIIRRKLLAKIVHDRRGSKRLAVFPDDLIGQEIVISGLHEGEILNAAFGTVLLQFQDQFATSTCLDVGANVGNHTCYLSDRFQRVIAFEPNPSCFHLLECNVKNNSHNAIVYNFGLSTDTGTLRFVENDKNLGGSGFVDEDNLNERDFKEKRLQVRNGDAFLLENYPNAKFSFIKIDVEGHEIQVLRGLEITIRKNKPIVALEMYSSRPGGAESMSLLREFGYERFLSITKDGGLAGVSALWSRLRSSVYAVDLNEGYDGDHDFVIAFPA
jgi:FkbM family methyltransferase